MSSAAPAVGGPPAARPPLPSLWREGVLSVTIGLTAVLAYLSNMSLSVLIALAGLLCLPALLKGRRPVLGLVFLALLALWALVSMSWSIYREAPGTTAVSIEDLTALKMLFEIGLYGAFVAAALNASPAAAARVSNVLVVAFLILALLFMIEGLEKAKLYFWIRAQAGQPTEPDYAIRDVARAAYALVLLFWPVAIRLETLKLRALAVAMGAAAAIGAWLLRADAPAVALVISVAVYVLVRWQGRWGLWACIAATGLYFIITPILVHLLISPGASTALGADPERLSWAIRLDIWRFAADRILERPLVGWGLDASRMFSPNILLHTHNGALQVWLELGLVGAVLALLFWTWLFVRLERVVARDRAMTAAAAAAASVYLVIGALSFGIWQEWWVALGAFAAAACALGFNARSTTATPASAETSPGEG